MKSVKLNVDVKCHIRRRAQEWWGAKCYDNGQEKELSVKFSSESFSWFLPL